jgi:hypothetical protein
VLVRAREKPRAERQTRTTLDAAVTPPTDAIRAPLATGAQPLSAMPAVVYPPHLALGLHEAWPHGGPTAGAGGSLPDVDTLTRILDILYQVSFLSEEGVPTLVRVVLADPCAWRRGDGPPHGFHVLPFAEPRPFTVHELRKLAPAVSYYRSLVGVHLEPTGEATIWGMIESGGRWVNRVHGGRYHGVPLPPHPVVHVLGPGRLLVGCGYERVLELSGGQLVAAGFDPFRSAWLPRRYEPVRAHWLRMFAERGGDPARIDPAFVRLLAQNVVKRIVSIVRRRAHGGMLISLPTLEHDPMRPSDDVDRMLRIRCPFAATESSRRFSDLMVLAMERLAALGAARGKSQVTWDDFQSLGDPQLAELDEAFLEMANLFADLMNVDGALVVTRDFDLVGFAAEVLGEFSVVRVHRALDLEATETVVERADASGTRHRAAYRFAVSVPESLVVVVSQDGATRFVANREGRVVYWPYVP